MLKEKISFQISYLKSLLDSENSCITVAHNFKGKLTLLPFHLGYLKHAVKELLDNKVSKYDPELNGIILGQSNIKIINSLKFSDSGTINLSYIADIYLFTPVTGKTLTGIVNKKSKEHIGCLIHSAFNASIPKPRNLGEGLNLWLRSHGSLQIGNELDFTVAKVDFTSRIPYISGVVVKNEMDIHNEECDSGVSCHDTVDENNKNFKKKKRKSKINSQPEVKKIKEECEEGSYHDPTQIMELLNSSSKPVNVKRKMDDFSDKYFPPVKKLKKEKSLLENDAILFLSSEEIREDITSPNSSEYNLPVKLSKIKKERLSLSPELDIAFLSPTRTWKHERCSNGVSQSFDVPKIKRSTDVDELTSSFLKESLDNCHSRKGDSEYKIKKRLDYSYSTDSNVQYKEQLNTSSDKKSNGKVSKKHRSDSPIVNTDGGDCLSRKSKKKKSRKSKDNFEELTKSILAETMSEIS